MLKTSTRIFAASAMAAMLIGCNTGAFACDMCTPKAAAKTLLKIAAKPGAKSIAKVGASAKAAAKVAPKNGVKLASLQSTGATESAEAMCPECHKEAVAAKAKK